jgi:hypothetical protein
VRFRSRGSRSEGKKQSRGASVIPSLDLPPGRRPAEKCLPGKRLSPSAGRLSATHAGATISTTWTRTAIPISITKEACKAFAAMPMLLIFPVLQAIGIAIFLIPWIIYCGYLASSGEVTVIKLSNGVVVGRDFECG